MGNQNPSASKPLEDITLEDLIDLVANAPQKWTKWHIAATRRLGTMLPSLDVFIAQKPQALANIARCRRLPLQLRDTAILILLDKGGDLPNNRFVRGFERRQEMRKTNPRTCGGPI